MAARDITLPDRAFAEMVSGFGARIASIEKAAMWSGVVRSAISNTGGTAPPHSATPVPPLQDVSVTVVQLDLDPGRWILLSLMGVNISVGSDHGGPFEGRAGSFLWAVSGASTKGRSTFVIQYGGGRPAIEATLTSAMEIRYETPTTVYLKFYYSLLMAGGAPPSDPFGSGNWDRATLLVFPG